MEKPANFELPPELWLEAFSNLDYVTLKYNVAPASKRFQQLLSQPTPRPERQLSQLDMALFRDFPATTGTQIHSKELINSIRLHPYLEIYLGMTLEYNAYMQRMVVVKEFHDAADYFVYASKLLEYFIHQTPPSGKKFHTENAVSPAASELTVRFRFKPMIGPKKGLLLGKGDKDRVITVHNVVWGSFGWFFGMWMRSMRYAPDKSAFLMDLHAINHQFEALVTAISERCAKIKKWNLVAGNMRKDIAEAVRRGKRRFGVDDDLGDDFGLRLLGFNIN